MFFTLSKQKDTRLPHHDVFGKWWFSHDSGWTDYMPRFGWKNPKWRKGYGGAADGNFLEIELINDIVSFKHPTNRSFPLWWDVTTQTLTNLLGTGTPIYADKKIVLFDEWLISESTDIHGEIETSTLSMDSVSQIIIEGLMDASYSQLVYNPKSKLFVSGGMDTATLLAVKFHSGAVVEVIDYEHFDHDEFTQVNISDIRRQHWGYRQMHHWVDDTVLWSGAYGDEYLMRGPATVALWCAWQDIDLVEILKKSQGYSVDFCLLDEKIHEFQNAWNNRESIRDQFPTYRDLVWHILDISANDHQHWHLGNTITWTPFLDANFLKTVLRLSQDDMISNIIDATVNRNVIEMLYPPCINIVSQSKNIDTRQNLHLLPTLYPNTKY